MEALTPMSCPLDHRRFRRILARLFGGLVVAFCVAITAVGLVLNAKGARGATSASGLRVSFIEKGADLRARRALRPRIPCGAGACDRRASGMRGTPGELFAGSAVRGPDEFEPDEACDPSRSHDLDCPRVRPHLDLSPAARGGGDP